MAAESKPSEPDLAGKKEQVSNDIKAHENDNTDQYEEPPRGISPLAVFAPAPVEEGLRSLENLEETTQQKFIGDESLLQKLDISEEALVPLSMALDSAVDVQLSKSGAESSEAAFDTEQEISPDLPLSDNVLDGTGSVEDIQAAEDSTQTLRSSTQEKEEQKADLQQRASNLEETLDSTHESTLSEGSLDENEHGGKIQELYTNDTHDVPVVSSPPRSLFGSWGKTMRNLVSNQPRATGDGDSTEDKLSHDRKRSMPGTFASEDPSPTPTPSEASLPGENKLPIPQLHDAAKPDWRDTEEHTECLDQEPTLVAEHVAVSKVASGDVGEELGIPNLGKDNRFDMSGEEPIPGTMTHGSDQASNEIPESIPGALAQPIGHSSLTVTHSQETPELETSPADGQRISSLEDHDVDQGYLNEESTKKYSVTAGEQDLFLQNETLDSVAEAAPRLRSQHTEESLHQPSLEVQSNSADDQPLDEVRREYAQVDPPTSSDAGYLLQEYQDTRPSSVSTEITTILDEKDVSHDDDMPQPAQLYNPALVLASAEDLQTLSAANVPDGGSNVSTHPESSIESKECQTDTGVLIEHQIDLDPELGSTESVLLRIPMNAPAEYSSGHKNDESMPADTSLSAETARDHNETEYETRTDSSLDNLHGLRCEVDREGEPESTAPYLSFPGGEDHKISDAERILDGSIVAPEDVSNQEMVHVRVDQEPGQVRDDRSAWDFRHENHPNGQQELTDQDTSPLMASESQSFGTAGNNAPELPRNHIDVIPKDDAHYIDYYQQPVSQEPRREVDPEVFVPPEQPTHADTEPQTPLAYQTQRFSLADELDQAEELYAGSYADGSAPYELGDVQATTVYGEDDLFDDDGNSNDSTGHGAGSDSVDYEVQSDEAERDTSRHEDAAAVRQEVQITANGEDRPETVAMNEESVLARIELPETQEFSSLETHEDALQDEIPADPAYSALLPALSTTTSLAPRVESPSAGRGLAASRHNPHRPQTPPQQQQGLLPDSFDTEDFLPRDVTNVPWHERTDSIPQSVRSQSTLSSSASSSPARSSPQVDAHEPAIRDSWATPIRGLGGISDATGRPRNDSQSTTEYDPIRVDEKQAPWWERGSSFAIEPAVEAPHGRRDESVAGSISRGTAASATGSPGSLFRRMRNVFENPREQQPGTDKSGTPSPPHFTGGGRDGTAWSGRGSPVRSRPASGVFHPPRNGPAVPGLGRDSVGWAAARRSISVTPIQDDGYDHPGDTKGSYLNEAEDEVDERSALLSTH